MEKKHLYSPSLHQDLYQKIIEYFRNYIPVNIIPNIVHDEDIDLVIDEIVNDKDFEISETQMETFKSIEELKHPQNYEDGGTNILDDSNGKEVNDPRVQALFKRSRLETLSVFIISQDYYELPERTIRANGTYITSSNQTTLEMFKFAIKIKHQRL